MLPFAVGVSFHKGRSITTEIAEMAETVNDILRDAFEDIVVSVDESALESSDARTGIRAINRIMSTLAANGAAFGFTKVDSVDDVITIPDGVIDSLISILALRLWPKYRSGEATITIQRNARNGLKQMYKTGITISATEFPSTLPRGSGNSCSNICNSAFYDNLESTILNEQNGSISLEDDTE
jgi:hypothetical protein